MNSPDNAGNKWFIVFYPPPCPDMNPFCLELGVRKKCFPFMWFLKPLPICLASVGSRSVGFLPVPLYVWIFGSNWYLEEENLGYTYSKKEELIAFFLRNYRRLYQIFQPLARLILAIPAYYVHCISRDLCVWTGFRWRNTLDMCLHRVWRIISMWAIFFSENSGWTRFLLNAVLHYITCAVDDVDAICPNFQDETGTACCIFTWLPRNLSRFNLRPCI